VRAWHCADVPFAFGNQALPAVEFLIGGPPSPADHCLAGSMVAAWASFAAKGDPGWQPLDKAGTGPAHVWAPDDARERQPLPDTRALWRDADYRPLGL
jgi:para-nitrobenzyl esterase